MNILGFHSSGNQTSVSIMIDMEVNSFNCSHERKERPDWIMFLDDDDMFLHPNSIQIILQQYGSW